MAQPEYSKKFTGLLTDADGNRRWFINGAYGREGDLPCVELADGTRAWYIENPKRGGFGQFPSVPHREGGPALIRPNGDEFYYHLGELHCSDGPALRRADGEQKWFEHGKMNSPTAKRLAL